MALPILTPPEHRWECPNCPTTSVTRRPEPHTEFHHCAGLAGLCAPMVEAGVKAKVTMHEREDYAGKEILTYDGNGRPVMNVVTTRDDGEDCAVYAPAARAGGD